jgi:hypothetical protein
LTLYPAIASATNFDVCVNEAKTNHNDTTAEGYTSYKCEGTIAEKLSARPDECTGGPKPSLRGITRKSKQLDDGLYSSLSWTAGKCTGSCETRSYDSKDTTYLCEVRVYQERGGPAPEAGREQLAPGPGAAGPGRPGLRPDPGEPGVEPGPRSRHAANERLRPRLPPPGWAPPPRRYSRHHGYRRYSHYRPSFSTRPSWFDGPPLPVPEYEQYPQPTQPPRCGCRCGDCY